MFFSIGDLAKQTGVKVPSIRYYQARGLLDAPRRSAGNQRRYGKAALDRRRARARLLCARDTGGS